MAVAPNPNQSAAPMTGTDEAAKGSTAPRPRSGLLSQPSTWSALWALGALLVLAFLRGTLRKLT